MLGASCVRPAPNRCMRLTSITIGLCRECMYCSWGTPILVIDRFVSPMDAYTPSGQVRPVSRFSECTYVVNSSVGCLCESTCSKPPIRISFSSSLEYLCALSNGVLKSPPTITEIAGAGGADSPLRPPPAPLRGTWAGLRPTQNPKTLRKSALQSQIKPPNESPKNGSQGTEFW